jgi:protocatechuate 3,4-dioxygenase beta subunit
VDKRIVLVLVAAMLVVGGWLWWSRDDASLVTPVAANTNRSDGDSAAEAIPDTAAAASELAVKREAAPTAPAAAKDPHDPDAEPTGELVVQVLWSDGEKAPGVRVYLAETAPGLSRPLAELVSDAAGQARAHISATKVRVTADRRTRGQKEVTADVAAGQRQEVVLQLDAGVAVAGSVRDGAGAPVAGAQVWLSSPQSAWCAGAFVTESGADGTFQLRDVPKGQSLGAVAKDFAPSKLVDLDLLDTTKEPVQVTLVLREPGGALAGRVVDEQGKPVAGAVLAIGAPERHMNHRTGDSFEEAWSPHRATTGDDGRYRIDGLAPGEQQIEVWGRNFAYWHGKVTIVAHETTSLDVTLLRGVTVFGTVTGEDGKLLAGAAVRCFPGPIATPFLQGGQYDYDSTFGCPFAVADAEGRYRLRNAAPGDLHLYAGPGGYRRHDETVCWADEVLHAEPGAVVEWNAKIDPLLQIRGVVRYRDGEPMTNVFITLIEPGTKQQQALVNDKHGRFRFVRLEKKPYDVSVQVWDPPKGAPPVEAREVWPESGELVLEAAFDSPKKQASGSVRGTISDAAGRLANPGALQVILATDHGSWWTQSNLKGASFHFKGIEPGKVRVIAMSGEDPILYGPWVELQPAEQKDLGALVTEPGGKIVLSVVRHPGTEALEPEIYLGPVDGGHGRRATLAKGAIEMVFDNLCPGEQRISAYAKGMASIGDGRCTVAVGTVATATIELRAAVEREIVVEYEATQRITRICVQDERGGKVFDYAQPRALERPYRIRLQLPVGRFTFFVETEGGGKAETAFELTSLAEGQPPVVLRAK